MVPSEEIRLPSGHGRRNYDGNGEHVANQKWSRALKSAFPIEQLARTNPTLQLGIFEVERVGPNAFGVPTTRTAERDSIFGEFRCLLTDGEEVRLRGNVQHIIRHDGGAVNRSEELRFANQLHLAPRLQDHELSVFIAAIHFSVGHER